MNNNTNFARKNLKFLRNSCHLGQEELANKLYMQQNGISMYETGKRPMNYEISERVAKFFNVPVELFLKSDLSELDGVCQKLTVEKIKSLGKVMIPILESSSADDNYFKRGIELFNEMEESIIEEICKNNYDTVNYKKYKNMLIDKLDVCIEKFIDSCNKYHSYEAAANVVGIVLFISGLYCNKAVLESIESILNQQKVDVKMLLQSPRSSSQDKADFIEMYGDLVIDAIKILKKNENWSELGDYYMALRLIMNATDNGYEKDMNIVSGYSLMFQLCELGNKYALACLEELEELFNEPISQTVISDFPKVAV